MTKIFEIHSISGTFPPLRVRSENWLDAFRQGMMLLGKPISVQEAVFSLAHDGHSAHVLDPVSGQEFSLILMQDLMTSAQATQEVPSYMQQCSSTPSRSVSVYPPMGGQLAPSPSRLPQMTMEYTPVRKPTVVPFDETAPYIPGMDRQPPFHYIGEEEHQYSREIPAVPMTEASPSGAFSSPGLLPQSMTDLPSVQHPMSEPPRRRFADSFSMDGKYRPGATVDFLTDAFMRVAELYDNFGKDRDAAIRYILEMLHSSIQIDGAGLLSTDLNDPMAELSFLRATGPLYKDLQHILIPRGKGALGYCAKEGIPLHLSDIREDERAKGEALLEVGLNIGPFLCTPLVFQERLEGLFYVYRFSQSSPFSLGEMNILNYFATAVSEYLGEYRSASL
ncbi:MAG: GAF domain-containing protein [Myxococcota bacterium]